MVTKNKMIVNSNDERLYVIALKDGRELWNYEIGQPVASSPAVLEGKIIVGSEDGRVYCFGAPAAKSAK